MQGVRQQSISKYRTNLAVQIYSNTFKIQSFRRAAILLLSLLEVFTRMRRVKQVTRTMCHAIAVEVTMYWRLVTRNIPQFQFLVLWCDTISGDQSFDKSGASFFAVIVSQEVEDSLQLAKNVARRSE